MIKDADDGLIQRRLITELCLASILITDNELASAYAESLEKRVFYVDEGVSLDADYAYCLASQITGGGSLGGRLRTIEQAVLNIKQSRNRKSEYKR